MRGLSTLYKKNFKEVVHLCLQSGAEAIEQLIEHLNVRAVFKLTDLHAA